MDELKVQSIKKEISTLTQGFLSPTDEEIAAYINAKEMDILPFDFDITTHILAKSAEEGKWDLKMGENGDYLLTEENLKKAEVILDMMCYDLQTYCTLSKREKIPHTISENAINYHLKHGIDKRYLYRPLMQKENYPTTKLDEFFSILSGNPSDIERINSEMEDYSQPTLESLAHLDIVYGRHKAGETPLYARAYRYMDTLSDTQKVSVLNDHANEEILTNIASNQKLPDNIRNRASQFGIDYNDFKCFNETTRKMIYEEIADWIFEAEKDKENKQCFCLLMDCIQSDKMPVSCMLDITERVQTSNLSDGYKKYVMDKCIENAKDERIMENIFNSAKRDDYTSTCMFLNPYTPMKIKKQLAEETVSKYLNGEISVCQELKNAIISAPLSFDTYKKILLKEEYEEGYEDIVHRVMLSPNIHKSTLKALLESPNLIFGDCARCFCKLNILFQDIAPVYQKNLYNMCKTIQSEAEMYGIWKMPDYGDDNSHYSYLLAILSDNENIFSTPVNDEFLYRLKDGFDTIRKECEEGIPEEVENALSFIEDVLSAQNDVQHQLCHNPLFTATEKDGSKRTDYNIHLENQEIQSLSKEDWKNILEKMDDNSISYTINSLIDMRLSDHIPYQDFLKEYDIHAIDAIAYAATSAEEVLKERKLQLEMQDDIAIDDEWDNSEKLNKDEEDLGW